MRLKTITGLAIVSAVGIGLAMLFQRDGQAPAGPNSGPNSVAQADTTPYARPSRGTIVPLPADQPHAAAAFLAAGKDKQPAARASGGDAAPGRIEGVPSIRREQLRQSSDSGPRLDANFPAPLALLGIDALTRNGAAAAEPQAEAFAGPVAGREAFSDGPAAASSPREAEEPPRAAEPVRHTIVDGDTLPDLAQRYLGDAQRAGEIYAANRKVLRAPDLLPIGTRIVIPAR